jgi:hypothetical protein
MASLRGVFGRIRGDHVSALADEVAALRTIVLELNHGVAEMRETLMSLNHDVRAGSPEVLPLFLGYAERFRTDADTMVGASELIDRQLTLIEQHVSRLTGAPPEA